MPRPRSDNAAIRARMIGSAERLLRQHGARKLALSDVASACGMSQSNAYRFFASRQDLLDAVGDSWFSGMEFELEQIVSSGEPAAAQFVRFIARQYELKRERAAGDPTLFAAYLGQGAEVPAVTRHLNRLRSQLEAILQRCAEGGMLGGRDATQAADIVEAMTGRYRDPALILAHMHADTGRRAAEAAGIVLAGLAHLPA